MTLGPVTIFDKSALQALNVDEACLFGNFYRVNITPMFFIETLADLEKEVAGGRRPEEVVGTIAHKTSGMFCDVNVHHLQMYLADLQGRSIEMSGVPVISGAQPVQGAGQKGVRLEQPPEIEAFRRWSRGEFLEVERTAARQWRKALAQLDLQATYERVSPLMKHEGAPRDFNDIRSLTNRIVADPSLGERALGMALETLVVPYEDWGGIVDRWKGTGRPALIQFAPYAAHVLGIDIFFALGVSVDLISRQRPSNQVDMAYLYYLPFCMVFTSSDTLHARVVPYFLGRNQTFVLGGDLKADLQRLDAHYSTLPDEVRATGLMTFAPHPPLNGEFLTSELWDRFVPRWRENAGRRIRMSPETEAALVRKVDEMTRGAPADGDVSLDEAAFLAVERRVPTQMGKWRILPPDAEREEE